MSNESRAAEAADAEMTVEFRDRVFTIPPYEDWPLELHEAFGDNADDVVVIRAALGPKQWAEVRTMGLKTRDLNELSGAVIKALGFGSIPESPASSD